MPRRPSVPPVFVPRVLDDPSVVRPLCERLAPYLPVQRYATNAAEAAVIGDQATVAHGSLFVAPNFRGDWAYDDVVADGAEQFLHSDRLAAAARELFDAEIVRPQIVYSNFTWQLPFRQGNGHLDVPAFRGVDRTRYPVWLLVAMGHSGLFQDEQVRIATAVCWFYGGADGGLDYWPDGGDRPPLVHEGDIDNTAIVGDNDYMFHRVRPVGDRSDGLIEGLTLDSELRHVEGDRWEIVESGTTLATMRWPEIRLSISWKAKVFADADEEARVDEHRDDLSLDDVVERFIADLAERGIAAEPPADPLADPDWIRTLSDTYVEEPSVQRPAA